MSWLRGNKAERGIRTVPGPGHVRGRLPSDRIPGLQPPSLPKTGHKSMSERLLGAVLTTTIVFEAARHEVARQLRMTSEERRQRRTSPFN